MSYFMKPSELEIGVEFSSAWAMLEFASREGRELGEAVANLTAEELFEFSPPGSTVSVAAMRFSDRFGELESLAGSFVSALALALSEAAVAAKRCVAGAFLGEASRIKAMRFANGDEFIDVIEAAHSCWPDEITSWPDSVPRPDLREVREFLSGLLTINSAPKARPVLITRVHEISLNGEKFSPESATVELSLDSASVARKNSGHTQDRIATVTSTCGTAIDSQDISLKFTVAFNAKPWPEDGDDPIGARVHDIIQIAARIVQALRQVVTNPIGGFWLPFEHANWMPISTDDDMKDVLRKSESGLIQCAIDDEQWLLMELDGDVVGRMIPTPTPLEYADEKQRGIAAEDAVRHSARWGLVDFIYRPHQYRKGHSGNREINDVAVISGEYGLAVQVKSKKPASKTVYEPGRVARLIQEAASQAAGSVRELRGKIRELTNDRGRRIAIDGNNIRWVGVVIIDHPNPPKMDTFVRECRGLPIVALFREEWEFLFEQLCSRTMVVLYLHAICPAGVLPGNHVAYYYRQAERARLRDEAADTTKALTELDPVWLPLEPASTIDMLGARMFRQILEDVACGDSPTCSDEDRLTILSSLDGLPAEERAQTGRFLIKLLEEANQNESSFRCRRYFLTKPGIQLCFVVSRAPSAHGMFITKAQLWHIEWVKERSQLESDTPYTVALLLTPQSHKYRPWATMMTAQKGSIDYSEEEIADLNRQWNESIQS